MPIITVIRNGDGCWPDLADMDAKLTSGKIVHLGNDAKAAQFAFLAAGMASGKASVTMRFDLPDGTVVLAETSLALLKTAVQMLAAFDES